MGYVAVKGGTRAIEASLERLRYERLKRGVVLDVEQARAGLRGLIDQVMSEASLYDEDVAALAVKQAEGSPEEAVFLVRAFRSTLPRLHYARTVDSASMRVERRVSATFKDVPGGQILGACYDYVHRLIDDTLRDERDDDARAWLARWSTAALGGSDDAAGEVAGSEDPPRAELPIGRLPKVVDYLREQGLMQPVDDDPTPPRDVTTASLTFPASRSERLQVLTRGQTGAVTALGYASLRGFGPMLHPTVGELRVGHLPVTVDDPFADTPDPEDAYYLGEIRVTEVESVVPVAVPRGEGRTELAFELGYGVCYGQNETKAIAMSLLDQCLDHPDARYPTHDEEFVLTHVDTVEATGFISHLKLPHYVTFQSELDAARATRDEEDA